MPNPTPEDISLTAREWGMSSGERVWVAGHCRGAKRVITAALMHATRPLRGPVDAGFLAPLSVDECSYFAGKIRPRVIRGGRIWVVYARTDPPSHGEFDGTIQELQLALATLGFCDRVEVGLENHYASVGFRFDPAASTDTAL
ncbi:MAG: hypothetical protein IIB57_06770 [Planctomycetes bacterium]|nr:hypothetical protein [Planctomycetota bacterium]